MSETTGLSEKVRPLIDTSIIYIAAIIAAAVSAHYTADLTAAAAATEPSAFLAPLVAIAIQAPIFYFVFDDWGGPKDIGKTVALTLVVWYVAWAFILTSGAGFYG